MKLMRHSDIRLTTRTYLDESGLPLVEALRTLPTLSAGKVSRIGSHISDSDRRDLACVVASWSNRHPAFSRAILAMVNSAADWEWTRMEAGQIHWRFGFEPVSQWNLPWACHFDLTGMCSSIKTLAVRAFQRQR